MYYVQVATADGTGWSSDAAGPDNGFIKYDDALTNGETMARDVWEGHPSWRIWLDDGTADGKTMYRNPGFPDDWWQDVDALATLIRYMADYGDFKKRDLASAVEKPWKYADVYAEALAEVER